MPKKQTTVPATVTSAAPARAAKPRTTTRVKTVKHSKAPAIDQAVADTAVQETEVRAAVVAAPVVQNSHEAIAKIAYGYWEARGYQHGYSHEDWLRAEAEYLSRQNA